MTWVEARLIVFNGRSEPELVRNFVLRFHRLMSAPRTRRIEATSVG
jgi:hypothetical protein